MCVFSPSLSPPSVDAPTKAIPLSSLPYPDDQPLTSLRHFVITCGILLRRVRNRSSRSPSSSAYAVRVLYTGFRVIWTPTSPVCRDQRTAERTMTRRFTFAALMLVCFFTTVLVGLRATGAAATGGGSQVGSGALDRALELVALMREKIAECAGTDPESLMPLFVLGAGAAAVAAFTLYLLGLYFDRDPFLFDGGKMGKLEAQSIYTNNKKRC